MIKTQLIRIGVVFVSMLAGLFLLYPTLGRALISKRRSDVKAAAILGVLQVVVYGAFVLDQSPKADEVTTLTALVVWSCAAMGAVINWYVFRPLSKSEAMDRAREEQQPGATYL